MTTKTNTQTFTFTGHSFRVVEIEGAPWFVAADACVAMGLDLKAGSSKWLANLGPDQRRRVTRDDLPQIFRGTCAGSFNLISESGLYKLVMRAHSSNPEAAKFQDWVTREVLPAIRKDGAYIQGEEKVRTGEMSEDELILKAIDILKTKLERVTAERDVLKAEFNRVTVDEYRALHHAYWDHSFRVRLGQLAAKLCRERGIEIEKQTREVRDHRGDLRETHLNVYDRETLDEAHHILTVDNGIDPNARPPRRR